MRKISLSIVIPLAKGEDQWQRLCQDFALLPDGSEIVLVASDGDDIDEQLSSLMQSFYKLSWQLIYSPQGRGLQLNKGAALASHPFIWFLHADSRITQDNIFTIWYPYPDSSVADWPRWTRYLIDNRTNETVYSYETKRRHSRARWTPDGSMLAVIEENPGGDKELIVIFPTMQPVKEVRLPKNINLIGSLPKKYRGRITEFEREQITNFTWYRDRQMLIDWIAHAPRMKNDRRIGTWTIKSSRRSTIQFDPAGNVKLIKPGTISVSESRD